MSCDLKYGKTVCEESKVLATCREIRLLLSTTPTPGNGHFGRKILIFKFFNKNPQQIVKWEPNCFEFWFKNLSGNRPGFFDSLQGNN